MPRMLFAQIDKLDNGYVLKYPEAVKRSVKAPSPLAHIDDAQIELFARLSSLGEDSDESWRGDDDERLAQLRKKIAKLRASVGGTAGTNTIDTWVLEEREFFCQTPAGLLEAVRAAEQARSQIDELHRNGIRLVPTMPQIQLQFM